MNPSSSKHLTNGSIVKNTHKQNKYCQWVIGNIPGHVEKGRRLLYNCAGMGGVHRTQLSSSFSYTGKVITDIMMYKDNNKKYAFMNVVQKQNLWNLK